MLFTDEQRAIEKMKKEHAKQSEELYAEIGRLTTQLAWLKKNYRSIKKGRFSGQPQSCSAPHAGDGDRSHLPGTELKQKTCLSLPVEGVVIQQPNQVWGIDITYIRLLKGWMYLTAVLDWYSRYVVSWELSDTLAVDFVCAAVSQAFSLAKPQIMNSDQGSQFTSPQ